MGRLAAPTAAALAAGLAAGLAGCDPAIEMTLVAPAEDPGIDATCVTAVEVLLIDDNGNSDTHCVEVAPGTSRTLRDHGLAGRIDMPLPPWTPTAVRMRAVAAAPACFGDRAGPGGTIFSAATPWRDGDLALPLRAHLDCRARVEPPVTVHVIDLANLWTPTPCAPPTDPRAFDVALATVQSTGDPRPLLAVYADAITEYAPVADGKASVRGAYRTAAGGACLGALVGPQYEETAGCVVDGPGVCAGAGELEAIYVSPAAMEASIPTTTLSAWKSIAFGAVFDAATRQPIAGATVTAPGEAAVVYTEFRGTHFANRTGAVTGADGSFKLLSQAPVEVTVSAPGHTPRTVVLGGVGGATVIALQPATALP